MCVIFQIHENKNIEPNFNSCHTIKAVLVTFSRVNADKLAAAQIPANGAEEEQDMDVGVSHTVRPLI
jgi:hypothetical protein